jgi:hypothetical protein
VVITSVFEETSLEDQGIMTGKIFECLGLGAPILLIAPPGSDTEPIVADMGLGWRFTGSNVDGMASFLIDAMSGRSFKAAPVKSD